MLKIETWERKRSSQRKCGRGRCGWCDGDWPTGGIIGIGYEWQLVVVGFIVVGAVALDMISRKKEI